MEAKYITGTPEIARFDFTRQNKELADKTSNRINLAAEYLWGVGYGNHGTEEVPILFSSLIKKQKLDIVGAYLENCINDAAKTMQSNKAQNDARALSETDFNTNQ